MAYLQATSPMAATSDPTFFDAALCNPPYSMTSATAIYDAAEKLAKPDTSSNVLASSSGSRVKVLVDFGPARPTRPLRDCGL